MPVYEYTALDIKGKTVSGIINAESPGTARQKLRASRNFPVSIKEVHDTAAIKAPSSVSIIRYFTRVRPHEVSMMTRQLATLVGAGFPLVSALDTLIPQTRSQGFNRGRKQLCPIIVSVSGNFFLAICEHGKGR